MTGDEGDTARPRRLLRADALRNEDRLLEAAAAALAREGAGASVKDIARAAGVGVGALGELDRGTAGAAEQRHPDTDEWPSATSVTPPAICRRIPSGPARPIALVPKGGEESGRHHDR
ncbi:hypothetical protein ACGFZQ_36915 [Streptomyces sp. NPDC048254]|uniref:hypothetical protein n=1 Tax=Streptomyces sp. NPDC048254 TaxID=3365525 RepID=UPI0037187598